MQTPKQTHYGTDKNEINKNGSDKIEINKNGLPEIEQKNYKIKEQLKSISNDHKKWYNTQWLTGC